MSLATPGSVEQRRARVAPPASHAVRRPGKHGGLAGRVLAEPYGRDIHPLSLQVERRSAPYSFERPRARRHTEYLDPDAPGWTKLRTMARGVEGRPSFTRRDVLRRMGGLGVVALAGGAGPLLSACTTAQSGGEVLVADPEIA